MTLEEAKAAILAADKHFKEKSNEDLAEQDIGGEGVNIIFGKKGAMWNYGIPNLYKMDKQYLGDLESWWKGVHPNSGEVLEPESKAIDAIAVNLQWSTEGGRLFNFHLPVTK